MNGHRYFEKNGTEVRCYTFDLNPGRTRNYSHMDPEELGAEVDRRIQSYTFDHPQVSYSQALQIVLDADQALKEAYSAPR